MSRGFNRRGRGGFTKAPERPSSGVCLDSLLERLISKPNHGDIRRGYFCDYAALNSKKVDQRAPTYAERVAANSMGLGLLSKTMVSDSNILAIIMAISGILYQPDWIGQVQFTERQIHEVMYIIYSNAAIVCKHNMELLRLNPTCTRSQVIYIDKDCKAVIPRCSICDAEDCEHPEALCWLIDRSPETLKKLPELYSVDGDALAYIPQRVINKHRFYTYIPARELLDLTISADDGSEKVECFCFYSDMTPIDLTGPISDANLLATICQNSGIEYDTCDPGMLRITRAQKAEIDEIMRKYALIIAYHNHPLLYECAQSDKYGKINLPGCGCVTNGISEVSTGFNQDCEYCNNQRIWLSYYDARYFKHLLRLYDYQDEELEYTPDGIMNGSCFYIQTLPWFNPYGAELWDAMKPGYTPSDRAKQIELTHPPIEFYVN